MAERVAPAPPRVEVQEQQLQERRDRFDIGAFSLPDGADPEKDYLIEANDAYQEFMIPQTGEVYRISENPDQRPLGKKVREGAVAAGKAVAEYAKDPSLPSGEQVKGFVEGMDEEMERMMYTEDRTLGDVAFSAIGSGVAGQFGTKPAGALSTFTARAYLPKEGPVKENAFGTFRNPIPQVLSEMNIPKKGIKGSEVIKNLQNNPEIRGSLLNATGLIDQIDPQKRYNKQDLYFLSNKSSYDARYTDAGDAFRPYQRQDSVGLQDPEIEYFVTPIAAGPGLGNSSNTFVPKSSHFDSSVISHARSSVRENDEIGKYILIEEIQSDLLQKGYEKPRKTKSMEEYLGEIEDDLKDSGVTLSFDIREVNKKFEEYKDAPLEDKYAKANEVYKSLTNKELPRSFNIEIDDPDYENLLNSYLMHKMKRAKGPDGKELTWFDSNVLYKILNPDREKLKAVSAPPIKKTKEGVDAALKGVIAEAEKRGVDKIVVPDLNKIVEARFGRYSDEAEEMLQEGSPFYNTYVKALSQSVKELAENYDVNVSEVTLPYDTSSRILDSLYSSRVLVNNVMDNMTLTGQEIKPDRVLFNTVRQYLGMKEGLEAFQYTEDIADTIGDFELVLEDFGVDMYKYDKLEDLDKAWAEIKEATQSDHSAVMLDISNLKNKYDVTRPRFAKGGTVPNMDEQMSLFAYGGLEEESEMERDPVSGNEIPVGGTAEGVRDDVEVNLSEGEYVVPEHITRLFGVNFFENLIKKGESILAEMEKDGRFGNEPEEEELPFDVAELQAEDDGEMSFAEGGAVAPTSNARGVGLAYPGGGGGSMGSAYTAPGNVPGSLSGAYGDQPAGGAFESRIYVNDSGQQRNIIFINGVPIQAIPKGFRPKTEVDEESKEKGSVNKSNEQVTRDVDPGGDGIQDRRQEEIERERSKIDVTTWDKQDFLNNLDQQQGMDAKGIKGLGGMLGMAGPMKIGQGITNRAAMSQLEALVEAGQTEYQDILDQYKEAGIEPMSDKLAKFIGVEFGPKGGLEMPTMADLTPNQTYEDIRDTTPDTNVYDSLRTSFRDRDSGDDRIQGSTSTQKEFADVTEQMTDLARNVGREGEGTAQQAASDRLDAAERDTFSGVSTSDFMAKGGLVTKPKFKTSRKKSSGKAKGLGSRK